MKNFKRPEGEKPYYYSSTVENGEVIQHEGEEEHAVYLSEMQESTRRSNLWHKWLEKNVKNAHDNIGCVDEDVMAKYQTVCDEFMDGLREE